MRGLKDKADASRREEIKRKAGGRARECQVLNLCVLFVLVLVCANQFVVGVAHRQQARELNQKGATTIYIKPCCCCSC